MTENSLNHHKTNFVHRVAMQMPLTRLDYYVTFDPYPSWHAPIVTDDFVFALTKSRINYQFVISSIIVIRLIPTSSKIGRCSAAAARLTGC